MPDGLVVDAFGGPGGWAEGLAMLGMAEVGVELDPVACVTRRAAGHRVIRTDVATMPLDHLTGRVDGLIMSPPCQAFSTAGAGHGRDLLDTYIGDIDRGDWTCRTPPHGPVGAEVLEVGRWAETLRPRWIACEQVPPVLPLWRAYAARWRALYGWRCWAGVLNAADFGVPQTRQRAFLVARTDGASALPPEPTHARHTQGSLFGELRPWVSMADALGWAGETEPARTLCGDRSPRWLYPDRDGSHGRIVGTAWTFHQPATTVAGDPRVTARCHHDEGTQGANAKTTEQVRAGDYEGTEPIRLTLPEALILQSFRPDYPVQGTKTKQFEQVGNAVPPLLAAHVLAAVTGRTLDLGVAA